MARLSPDQIMEIQILYFNQKFGVDDIMDKTGLSRPTVKRHTVDYEMVLYKITGT